MLKGFEIGNIERIELNDDNQVDVLFSVQDTYYSKVLPTRARADLQSHRPRGDP